MVLVSFWREKVFQHSAFAGHRLHLPELVWITTPPCKRKWFTNCCLLATYGNELPTSTEVPLSFSGPPPLKDSFSCLEFNIISYLILVGWYQCIWFSLLFLRIQLSACPFFPLIICLFSLLWSSSLCVFHFDMSRCGLIFTYLAWDSLGFFSLGTSVFH